MKWHLQAIAHNVSVVDLNVLALLISAHDHKMTDIFALESSAFKRPWLALNEWISGPRAWRVKTEEQKLMPALRQILLDTEIICKPNVCKAMFAARKLHSSELVNWFAKKITNLNPRLLLLQRKERERAWERGWKPVTMSNYEPAIKENQLLLIYSFPKNYGRFQDGGNFVHCRPKRSQYFGPLERSVLFSSRRAILLVFFIVAAKFFSWHDIFIRVPLLMRCNRITVILSLGFLVVVLVSVNIFLLSQLQYKERFNRKETLFKVRSLGIFLRVYKTSTLKDLVTNVPRAICGTSSRRAGDRGRGSQQTRQPSPLEP